MPQFVRLVNTDDKPFDYHYRNVKHIVRPLGDTVVPWDCACSLFGDPSLVNTPKDPARQRVYKQVRGLYNYEDGVDTAESWEQRRPHIEVYDLETSERIYMVLEDPEGLASNPDLAVKSSNDVEYLTRQIAQLSSVVMQLQAQQQANQRAEGQTHIPSVDTPDANAGVPETFSLPVPDDSDAGATVDTPRSVSVDDGAPKLAPRPKKQ
jgi:hypothetical protein